MDEKIHVIIFSKRESFTEMVTNLRKQDQSLDVIEKREMGCKKKRVNKKSHETECISCIYLLDYIFFLLKNKK